MAFSSQNSLDDKTATADYLERSTASQKTPISYLQEICIKKATKPEYELLSSEGHIHEPVFVFRVSVNDMSAIGQGKSKKVAKHLAAKSLLERIVAVGRFKEFGLGESLADATENLNQLIEFVGPTPRTTLNSGDDEQSAVIGAGTAAVPAGDDSEGPGNSVGGLQEMCQEKKLPSPIYELINEDGVPHQRVFVVTVTVGRAMEKGYGRSKKAAKKDASEKMFKVIEKIPTESQREQMGITEEDELAETGGGRAIVQQPFEELHEHLTSLSQQSQNPMVSSTVIPKEKRGLKTLAQLNLATEQPNEKHIALLKLIGDEENWEQDYYFLQYRRDDDEYKCLVQLNAMPVAVCYGRGATKEHARQSAAYHVLQYLKAPLEIRNPAN